MIKPSLLTCLTLFLAGLLQGAESYENLQDKKEQWVHEIQLSGTFRLGGKGFASLITPRGNFWVEEGKSSSCLLYTSPSPRDQRGSRMPSSA